MMIRSKWYLPIAVFALLLVVFPVQAVKWGQPDNGEHPYVGLIVFFDNAGVPQWRCTGTLISPKVVLTAAHCTELEGPARIWFNEDVRSAAVPQYPYGGGDSYTGKAYKSPWWKGGLYLPNTGDVGVVVLDKAVNDKGVLPTLAPTGYLDTLAIQRGLKDVSFEVVGYGVQDIKPVEVRERIRLKGWVQLINLGSHLTDGYNIATTNNPGEGTGGSGTCFGDSGGPIFSDGHKIVAVNSFVMNSNCSGTSYGYRIDRKEVLDWINSFMKKVSK